MKRGTLYGIGVGPGDPELITVKGARILGQCRRVFVPKARTASESVALSIAGRYLKKDSQVQELVFPMTPDRMELSQRWEESAREITAVLETGEDACFLTLGDPLLYSTYIYLLRALRARLPGVEVVTVPGVPAFAAAAALTDFPIGEAKQPVTIVPVADDLEADASLDHLDHRVGDRDHPGLVDLVIREEGATDALADEGVELIPLVKIGELLHGN